MMTLSVLQQDLYGLIGVKSTTARSDIQTAVTRAIRRAQERFVNFGDWSFLNQFQDTVYIPLAAPYSTGTVTVTQDSKTVTGSSTVWSADSVGDFLVVGSGEAYEIQTVPSTTSLTLAIPYQSATGSGASYAIYKRFYPLPLNFVRPFGRDAKLAIPGANNEYVINYHSDASFTDRIYSGRPTWFGIAGNTKRGDYFNTGTVTIATSGGTSTWTISSGTLPTDIVDREVRIQGESRTYRINARTGATTFTTYQTYFNPSDATSVVSAATYAITPKETKVVGFYPIADQRYIFELSYIHNLDDLIVSTDVSPIVLAGYEDAFIALCRMILAQDGRTAMRGDQVGNLIQAGNDALASAWEAEQRAEKLKWEGAVRKDDRSQVGPSWISR